MAASTSDIDHLLDAIPGLYRGPGGAAAVLQNGEVVSRRVWGYADIERRICMTAQTQMPICSITKQMLCLVMIDLSRNPTRFMTESAGGGDFWQLLDVELRQRLPQLFTTGNDDDEKSERLTVAHLYNMQSGIRDYWVMTALWGARPEEPFSLANDAPRALERTQSFHFPPGTQSSYSNVNFHILARMVEKISGESLGQLLAQRLFIPAGMASACLAPNTAGAPLPCVGYEGDEKRGFVPAVNRIEWSGDAGAVMSFDDLIAYEKYLDRSWSDAQSLYRAIARPQTYNDGSPAHYVFGLRQTDLGGYACLGHSGGLRGWRLQRVHVPEQRLSVVVMFNHEVLVKDATDYVLRRVLDVPEAPRSTVKEPAAEWVGDFLDTETQRVISVGMGEEGGEVLINYSGKEENVKLTDVHAAESHDLVAAIENDDWLRISRKDDNARLHARRIVRRETDAPHFQDYRGQYLCAEADSTFVCTGEGAMGYGSFDGFLGKGPAHLMRYIGEDIWILACPRGMDAPAPGDWTVVYHRDDGGRVVKATIGALLARRLEFVKKLDQ